MDSMESVVCARCESDRVVTGKMEDESDGSIDFLPDGMEFKMTLLSRPSVRADAEFMLCVDCGLIWSEAEQDTEGILATLLKFGKPEVLERLGISDA